MQILAGGAPFGTTGGVLHIGPNSDPTADTIMVTITPTDTVGLGISAAGLVVTSQTDATAAITTLDDALTSINTLRSDLGAKTNRLEHAITNQENQEQNMQAAESVIRDADFAHETTVFSRNQILQQSSTAMLAQANMIPQNVLSLLQ